MTELHEKLSPEISEKISPMYITSEDIRQYIYCPRIPFFRTIIRFTPLPTAKMEHGQEIHSEIHQFTLPHLNNSRYPDRYINLYLTNPDLNIHGQVDALEIVDTLTELDIEPNPYAKAGLSYEGPKTIGTVIEIKTGKPSIEIQPHHKAQVVFQSLLMETNENIRIFAGKIYYTQNRSTHSFAIWPGDKKWITQAILRLHQIYLSELIPDPTHQEQKCTNCEYWPVCQRV